MIWFDSSLRTICDMIHIFKTMGAITLENDHILTWKPKYVLLTLLQCWSSRPLIIHLVGSSWVEYWLFLIHTLIFYHFFLVELIFQSGPWIMCSSSAHVSWCLGETQYLIIFEPNFTWGQTWYAFSNRGQLCLVGLDF